MPAERGYRAGAAFARRAALYVALTAAAVYFLVPVYVPLVTALKSFADVNLSEMWSPPRRLSLDGFGRALEKLSPNLLNSLALTLPATVVSSLLGSLNGYVFAKWRFRGADLLFVLILFGMFIPYQSILIPLVQFLSSVGLYGRLSGLIVVHIIWLDFSTTSNLSSESRRSTIACRYSRCEGNGLNGWSLSRSSWVRITGSPVSGSTAVRKSQQLRFHRSSAAALFGVRIRSGRSRSSSSVSCAVPRIRSATGSRRERLPRVATRHPLPLLRPQPLAQLPADRRDELAEPLVGLHHHGQRLQRRLQIRLGHLRRDRREPPGQLVEHLHVDEDRLADLALHRGEVGAQLPGALDEPLEVAGLEADEGRVLLVESEGLLRIAHWSIPG